MSPRLRAPAIALLLSVAGCAAPGARAGPAGCDCCLPPAPVAHLAPAIPHKDDADDDRH